MGIIAGYMGIYMVTKPHCTGIQERFKPTYLLTNLPRGQAKIQRLKIATFATMLYYLERTSY